MTDKFLLALLLGASMLGACRGPRAKPVDQDKVEKPPDQRMVELNNRAVGLMGQFNYEEAAKIFQQLCDEYAEQPDLRVNLAIATLNKQGEVNMQRATQILESVLQQHPRHLRANYCLGLLKLYEGGPRDPRPHFELVAQADEQDADAAYLVALSHEQHNQSQEADRWYSRVLEADPYYASALLGKSRVARREGRTNEAIDWINQFQRMKVSPQARIFEFKYIAMGRYGEAWTVDESKPEVRPPSGPLFAPVERLQIAPGQADAASAPPGATIAPCDVDLDGDLDLFCTRAQAESVGANLLLENLGDGSFRIVHQHPLAEVAAVNAALWGDIDNDGRPDVFLCRSTENQLWHQSSSGSWSPMADAAFASDPPSDTVGGAMFDADHDGDLDIFCLFRGQPDVLFNNNRDGTFRPLAADYGIVGSSPDSRQVVLADFDHDRDTDLLVINTAPPHDLFLNDRLWSYRRAQSAGQMIQAPIDAAVAADFDADGYVDVASVTGTEATIWNASPAVPLSRNASEGTTNSGDGTGSLSRGPVYTPHRTFPIPASLEPAPLPRLAAGDVNGDGLPELMVAGGRGVTVFTSAGSQLEAIELPPDKQLRCWAPVAFDPERGPGIVMLTADGQLLEAAPGPGRSRFATVQFSGQQKEADSLRSNASGIGTSWAARIGSRWASGTTFPTTSGPSQFLQPTPVGLASHDRIDFLRINWSDGVFQSEVGVEPGQLTTIEETQRQLSSCPLLFAWNGREYLFVTDLLGVGGIGYLIRPGEYAPARPWERLLMTDQQLRPRQGTLLLKLAEPMEEACYLDHLTVFAHDIPPGWQITLDERMGVAEPAPTGEARYYQELHLPIAAVDRNGVDQLPALLQVDHVAADIGPLDGRFLGLLADTQELRLRFDRELDTAQGDPILIMDGWVEYPYSQTMFAAWQASKSYCAPSIDARADRGEWVTVLERFGYPAGMPRQMSVPLSGLPEGTVELRIRTNMEVYWDRIGLAYARPCPQAHVRELSLDRAVLRRAGFAKRATHAQRRPSYDYHNRTWSWDARHLPGWYTRFGPVEALVAARDNALAVFGPGEEIEFRFESLRPISAHGWRRVYVVAAEGWCKDMDLYTQDGDTLCPLPATDERQQTGENRRDALHSWYNTRFEASRP